VSERQKTIPHSRGQEMVPISVAPEIHDDPDRILDFRFERAPEIAARRDDIAARSMFSNQT
jgi:hypothetical protein